jgi:hypothetical protein
MTLMGTSVTEQLLALAVLDLPFAAAAEKVTTSHHPDGGMAAITAGQTPVLVFQKAIVELPTPVTVAGKTTQTMITQHLFDPREPTYLNEDKELVDRFLSPSDQLVPLSVYGIRVVVLNMMGTAQQLEVLFQIPVGSIPIGATKTTTSVFFELNPYATRAFEMFVYFPAHGTYPHFPAHLFKRGQLIGYANSFEIAVVSRPTVSERTWEAMVKDRGNDDEVLAYLQASNWAALPVPAGGLLEARLRADPHFFRRVIEVCKARLLFQPTWWKYSLLHDDLPLVVEYLSSGAVGDWQGALAGAGLLPPVEFSSRLEYENLINPRIHEFGARRKILNDAFRATYLAFLWHRCQTASSSAEDDLRACYYLLQMDRFVEAGSVFQQATAKIAAGHNPFATDINQSLLYQWYQAYFLTRRHELEAAHAIAAAALPLCPDQRSRQRFQRLMEEIAAVKLIAHAGTPSGAAAMLLFSLDPADTMMTPTSEPQLAFTIDQQRKVLVVDYANLPERQLTVNYYHMDVELLFSIKPFLVQTDPAARVGNNFQYIQPTRSATVALPAATASSHEIPICPEFADANVLIELQAGPLLVSESLYAHSLCGHIFEKKGGLAVFSQKTGRPLAGAYVKVYSRPTATADGSFYKDGYTDFAGRFDYAHLNNEKLSSIHQFSLLIMTPDHGAVILLIAPPHAATAVPMRPL